MSGKDSDATPASKKAVPKLDAELPQSSTMDRYVIEVRRQQQAARRRWLLGTVVVVVAAALPLGVWYGLTIRKTRLCKVTEEDLRGVWDGPTKAAVHKAFLHTNKAYAADTWKYVERALDSFTHAWAQMRAESCEATWLRGAQSEDLFDLRMGCLGEGLRELRTLVGVLAKADSTVLANAVQASMSLAGVDTCADEEALRARFPPPTDEHVKAEVEGLRERVGKIVALRETGKYPEGLELAQELVKAANAVAYPPLQAEGSFELGVLLDTAGEFQAAETALYEAARYAGESRDGVLAAKAVVMLVWVIGYNQTRYDAAFALGKNAEVMLATEGGDDKVRAQLLHNLGAMSRKRGGIQQAIQYYDQANEIYQRVYGPEHPAAAASLNNLGVVFWGQRNYEKARHYYERTLHIWEKTLGPEHPNLGKIHNKLGLVFSVQGKSEEAQAHFERALEVWNNALGPEQPELAWPLYGLGDLFRKRGDREQAQHFFERVANICSNKTCQPDPTHRSQFGLAKLLWPSPRARELLKLARDGYAKKPVRFEKEIADVDLWLEEQGTQGDPGVLFPR